MYLQDAGKELIIYVKQEDLPDISRLFNHAVHVCVNVIAPTDFLTGSVLPYSKLGKNEKCSQKDQR